MFKKHLISIAMLWGLFILVFFAILYTFSPEAQTNYQQLMNNRDEIKKEHRQEKAFSTQQMRYQVGKQILYEKDSQRLQSRLMSDYSELTFNPKEGETELVEHFKELTCIMQEKILEDSKSKNELKQYMRYLKAEQAIYSYKSGQLEAEDVEVAQYLIPGLVWSVDWENLQPLLRGQARKLELSLFKEPSLRAQGFQAVVCQWGDDL